MAQGFPCWFDGSGENRGHFAIWETVATPFAEGRPK